MQPFCASVSPSVKGGNNNGHPVQLLWGFRELLEEHAKGSLAHSRCLISVSCFHHLTPLFLCLSVGRCSWCCGTGVTRFCQFVVWAVLVRNWRTLSKSTVTLGVSPYLHSLQAGMRPFRPFHPFGVYCLLFPWPLPCFPLPEPFKGSRHTAVESVLWPKGSGPQVKRHLSRPGSALLPWISHFMSQTLSFPV